jgi:hypothetical protein
MAYLGLSKEKLLQSNIYAGQTKSYNPKKVLYIYLWGFGLK